ncbi:D-inositol-3-phosphate glycosyltransferase [subsurface metagenome]
MKDFKVLIITNIISPYRIPLFNSISEKSIFNSKVLALAESEENRKWVVKKDDIKFDYEILPGWHFFIRSKEISIHLNRGIFKIFWKYNPEIVITSGYDSLVYWQAFLYCKIFKKKFIVWNGSNLLTTRSKSGIRGKLKHIIIKAANRYIAYGIKAKEYLEYFGANSKHIYISRNTVDMKYFRDKVFQYRNRINFKKERQRYPKYLLLYVGQLTKGKGIIRVLKLLNNLVDPDVGFIIVGSGPEEKKLKAYCTQNKLQNVIFEGFRQQDKLYKYYALADIFIFPSFYDIWGLVVNEALASGLYVLSSKYVGASYDLIKEGWNGEIFEPYDIEEVVNLFKRVKENIEDIRDRRDDISQYACREFNIEKSADDFIRAIKSF